jgi:hypothetical protein
LSFRSSSLISLPRSFKQKQSTEYSFSEARGRC